MNEINANKTSAIAQEWGLIDIIFEFFHVTDSATDKLFNLCCLKGKVILNEISASSLNK